MSEWKAVALGDVAQEVTVGHVGTMARHYQESGVPFLRSLNIQPHRIDLVDIRYVSPDFDSTLQKSALRPGDVVTVRTGKPGTTAVIPDWLPVSNCSDLVITRPGPDLDARWFSYFMNSAASGFISSQLVGAVQQHFNVGSAKKLSMLLPPRPEQEAIAEVLGALDDKIAANAGLILSLSHAADAQFSLLARTASELEPLGSSVLVIKGVSYKSSDLIESNHALVTLKSFTRDGFYSANGLKSYAGPFKPAQEVLPGDVIVAQTDLTQAAEVVGRAVMAQGHEKFARLIASLDVAIVRPIDDTPREFLLGVTRDPRFQHHCRSHARGTTVLHLASNAIETYMAPIVSAEEQRAFARRVGPMHEMAGVLESENRTLAATRDALLPQLMSGKLRVKDAEALVANAV